MTRTEKTKARLQRISKIWVDSKGKLTIEEIAQIEGVTYETVSRYITKYLKTKRAFGQKV